MPQFHHQQPHYKKFHTKKYLKLSERKITIKESRVSIIILTQTSLLLTNNVQEEKISKSNHRYRQLFSSLELCYWRIENKSF